MTVEEVIYSTLSAAAPVTALCPASRIKVPGTWQNLSRPYIVHSVVTERPIYTHEGLAAMRQFGAYQVSVIADKYGDAKRLGTEVVNALTGLHSGVTFFLTNQTYFGRDDASETEQINYEFSVFGAVD